MIQSNRIRLGTVRWTVRSLALRRGLIQRCGWIAAVARWRHCVPSASTN